MIIESHLKVTLSYRRSAKLLFDVAIDNLSAWKSLNACSLWGMDNWFLKEPHNRGIWPKEGWFNTGDLGRQDVDGYFWLTGRKKELIIRLEPTS